MSFYQTRILPWLLDLAMRQRQLLPFREPVLAAARGRVLEVGIFPATTWRTGFAS